MERYNDFERPVKQYTIDGKYIATYSNVKEAAIVLCKQPKPKRIVECCNGIRFACAGYKWEYA
ncbi:NUMOD1 domain-containing DNA-binding protein [Faecalimonas sp. LCP19S3_D12]